MNDLLSCSRRISMSLVRNKNKNYNNYKNMSRVRLFLKV